MLYTKKCNPFAINALGKTLEGLVDFICSPKALNAGIVFCLRESINYALQQVWPKSPITDTITDMIASISSVCATLANPLNVINLGLSATGDTFGRVVAYQIIYLMPKLKREPIPDAASDTPVQVIKGPSADVPALRRIRH